jgi:hypothetical protein
MQIRFFITELNCKINFKFMIRPKESGFNEYPSPPPLIINLHEWFKLLVALTFSARSFCFLHRSNFEAESSYLEVFKMQT